MSILSTFRAALGGVLLAGLCVLPATSEEITVFAAASLKNALDTIATDHEAATGVKVTVSYAGTSALAKQIEQGAPADIFFSADLKWMDTLREKGLVKADTIRTVVGNTLVLVAHGAGAPQVDVTPALDLSAMLGDGRLAMALVDSVPAGVYGRQALQSLGLWASVEAKVAQTENVRAALALVAAGEAPFGIVYATDAVAEADVTVVGRFPAASHDAILYPAALTASAKPAAVEFLDVLMRDAARRAFDAQGFVLLP